MSSILLLQQEGVHYFSEDGCCGTDGLRGKDDKV